MKIALIGYGKMGKAIEKLAVEEGHSIVLKVNDTPTHIQLVDNQPDVAIEFTRPESAYRNIVRLLQSDIPTVSGTTGWTQHLNDIEGKVDQYNGSFIYASNFSLGVNLFFDLIEKAARLMKEHPLYSTSIQETHHTEKKDAPSGTAITMAEKIMLETSYKAWE
ncbi:MAG: 4-hydroxy-tetrahydrodipicolinate reductase, partial [Weeksellaceae bacterium]